MLTDRILIRRPGSSPTTPASDFSQVHALACETGFPPSNWYTIIPDIDILSLRTAAKRHSTHKRPRIMTSFPIVATDEGVTRQVLADHPDLMVVAFRFASQGAEGALHNHPHVQSTFVESGRFRFVVDDVVTEVGPGDSFVIPSNAVHGCLCLAPGKLIDTFTPRRDDFL